MRHNYTKRHGLEPSRSNFKCIENQNRARAELQPVKNVNFLIDDSVTVLGSLKEVVPVISA